MEFALTYMLGKDYNLRTITAKDEEEAKTIADQYLENLVMGLRYGQLPEPGHRETSSSFLIDPSGKALGLNNYSTDRIPINFDGNYEEFLQFMKQFKNRPNWDHRIYHLKVLPIEAVAQICMCGQKTNGKVVAARSDVDEGLRDTFTRYIHPGNAPPELFGSLFLRTQELGLCGVDEPNLYVP